MQENNENENLEIRNRRLREAVNELSILNDIAIAISSVSSLDEVISLIVKKCIKHLEARQCTVTLLEEEDEKMPFRTFVRELDTSRGMQPFKLDNQIAGWMIKNKKALIVKDLENDGRFHVDNRSSGVITSMLCAPLTHKGKLIGSINLFNKKTEEGFTDENKRLLSIIASQSAQVIKNARLLEEEKAYQALKEEMKLAYSIQMELLPGENPRVDGYDIAGISIPAKAVGGDYYDFMERDSGILVFCIGDVVGKGMPAALLMSNTQATLRAQVENSLSPSRIITRSNALLFRSTDAGKFVTLFLGVLDYENHRINYCNAGHEYPLLFRKSGGVERLDTEGLILGAVDDFDFGEDSTRLEPGEILLLYSDGITEAFNPNGDQFGLERLEAVMEKNRKCSSKEILSEVVKDIRKFADGREQSDDITLIMIRRTEE